MEHEYRMKEIEIRNRDMGASGDAETNPNTNNNNSSRSAGMKALKLPPFNEDKDDLDAYLIRFERASSSSFISFKNKIITENSSKKNKNNKNRTGEASLYSF